VANKPEAANHQNNSLIIFEDGWTKLPAFFVDELMPIGAGIPASFWKYMVVLWRDIVDTKPGFRAAKTMTQFHVGKDAAMKWTAALHVSGLFNVRYGVRHKPNEPGIPTKFEYLNGTRQEWICFITALRDTVLEDKRENQGDVEGFRIGLTFNLRDELVRNGLYKQALKDFHQALHDRWVKEGRLWRVDDAWEWNRKTTNRSRLVRD
jgi:hypothetical protein